MKVNVFAALVRVQNLLVAHIEQSQPMCSDKLESDGDEEVLDGGDGGDGGA